MEINKPLPSTASQDQKLAVPDAWTRFRECAADKQGTTYFDYYDEGVRILILRGPCSVCCYFGVPSDHPLAGHSYEQLPVQCHGGFTFGWNVKDGDRTGFPAGYWYGFDYGHGDDRSFYDLDREMPACFKDSVEWTPEMVKKDIWRALYDFKHLMRLAEEIQARVKGWRG